jgi:HSP20 family protein
MALCNYSTLLDNFFDLPLMRGIKWDLAENDSSYVIEAELPGADPDHVNVKTNNGILTIEAQKEETKFENNTKYHYQERCSGSFRRSVRLPSNSDPDGITAHYSNGLLKVVIPKNAKSTSKQITIQRD